MITYDEMLELARKTWDEDYAPEHADEYCAGMPVHRQSFIWGFQEAYYALSAIFYDKMSLVKRMRDAQIEKDESDQGYRTIPHICILEKKDRLESEVDEYLKKMEE